MAILSGYLKKWICIFSLVIAWLLVCAKPASGHVMNYKGIGCEGQIFQFACPSGYFISVFLGTYGRDATDKCTAANETTQLAVPPGGCSLPGALDIIKQKCNGKDTCDLPINKDTFPTDPCPKVFKYMTVEFDCKEPEYKGLQCEDAKLSLECPGSFVIKISSVFHGRLERTTCRKEGAMNSTNCTSTTAQATISQLCDHKAKCDIYAQESLLGDPCPGTFKYLEIIYNCAVCVNEHRVDSDCRRWTSEGECTTNPDWMRAQCRGSCWQCAYSQSCPNVETDLECNYWASIGDCKGDQWMTNNCRKSCNKCPLGGSTPAPPPAISPTTPPITTTAPYIPDNRTLGVADGSIRPNDSSVVGTPLDQAVQLVACEGDSATLECTSGSYLRVHSATFGRTNRTLCTHQEANTDTCYSRPDVITKLRATCEGRARCVPDAYTKVWGDPCPGIYKYLEVYYTCQACENIYLSGADDAKCAEWAAEGECEINPIWMGNRCFKACSRCDRSSCGNAFNEDPASCDYWSTLGECVNNVDWMTINCKESCRECPLVKPTTTSTTTTTTTATTNITAGNTNITITTTPAPTPSPPNTTKTADVVTTATLTSARTTLTKSSTTPINLTTPITPTTPINLTTPITPTAPINLTTPITPTALINLTTPITSTAPINITTPLKTQTAPISNQTTIPTTTTTLTPTLTITPTKTQTTTPTTTPITNTTTTTKAKNISGTSTTQSTVSACLPVCGPRGRCTVSDTCACDAGYTGATCENFSCVALGGCREHGTCVGPGVCRCAPGWDGADCADFHCRDVSGCSGRGRCHGPNMCYCFPYFSGADCAGCPPTTTRGTVTAAPSCLPCPACLYGTCVINVGNESHSYVGCYADALTMQDLDHVMWRGNAEASTSLCMDDCRARNYKYAGLQSGHTCYCSNSFGTFGASTGCSTACTGGTSGDICGGTLANSIWKVFEGICECEGPNYSGSLCERCSPGFEGADCSSRSTRKTTTTTTSTPQPPVTATPTPASSPAASSSSSSSLATAGGNATYSVTASALVTGSPTTQPPAPVTTPAPGTAAPTSTSSVTSGTVTSAPVTSAPITPTPVTPAPTRTVPASTPPSNVPDYRRISMVLVVDRTWNELYKDFRNPVTKQLKEQTQSALRVYYQGILSNTTAVSSVLVTKFRTGSVVVEHDIVVSEVVTPHQKLEVQCVIVASLRQSDSVISATMRAHVTTQLDKQCELMPNFCLNGGSFDVDQDAGYICHCPESHTGRHCETTQQDSAVILVIAVVCCLVPLLGIITLCALLRNRFKRSRTALINTSTSKSFKFQGMSRARRGTDKQLFGNQNQTVVNNHQGYVPRRI